MGWTGAGAVVAVPWFNVRNLGVSRRGLVGSLDRPKIPERVPASPPNTRSRSSLPKARLEAVAISGARLLARLISTVKEDLA